MKASMPTSTALARILVLPVTAGLLAGCDYASKLPDAPTTLGYELQTKPPSVTAAPQGVAQAAPVLDPIGPPLPPAMQAEFDDPEPVAVARLDAPQIGTGLDTQALRVTSAPAETTRTALARPPSLDLPVPQLGVATEPVALTAPQTGLARSTTVGAPPERDIDGYAPPPIDFPVAQYEVPQIGVAVESDARFPEYAPIPFDADPEPVVASQPGIVETAPLAVAALPAAPAVEPAPVYETVEYGPPASAPVTFEPQSSTVLYSAQPLAEPLPLEMSAPAPVPAPVTIQSQPIPAPSPIMVLHTRLDNGAIVNVHPVVGAPGAASILLARTIASELGSSVNASATASAPAVFDLRASASRGGQRAEAEWKLFSSTGALVGVFPESQSNGNWTTMGDDAVRAMGRRVADRLRRNADLRRATITSVAGAPPIATLDYGAVLTGGAPSLAPPPRPRPLRTVLQSQAVPAPAVPVRQFAVNTESMIGPDPFARAIPRRRPEGVRTAALSPTTAIPSRPVQPVALTPPAPVPVQPIAVAPLPSQPVAAPPPPSPVAPAPVIAAAPAPKALAPLGRPLPPQPIVSAPPVAVPAPSFDTLRAATEQPGDGPRSLVFRGVRGAPGDGDQALGREVSRLLKQSGAQLAPNGTPNALYLTADVSRSRNGPTDKIKIVWFVEDSSGKRVGQVVQENDVPVGALDANWGEDAFYAAQGARDGIMELLRKTGALDA